jgi:hypothetical protein
MSTILSTGLIPLAGGAMNGNARTGSGQAAALRPLHLLIVTLLTVSLVFLALPNWARASHEATWSNSAPAIVAASRVEEGGPTWSETPPSIIGVWPGDGGSSWYNSAPEIVLSSTAQHNPAWSQSVPPQAAAR